MLEWLSTIDPEKWANAILVLLLGLLSGFGLRSGKRVPAASDAPSSTVEVAGALVDGSSVKMLAGEMAGQTIALTAQTAAMKDQTQELEEVRHSINRVREALDRVTMEVARRR